MEVTVEKKIIEIVGASKKVFEEKELIQKYEEALKKYEELVKKGVTKKRGNNLISITDLHLHKSLFNSSENEGLNLLSTNLY